MPKIPKDIIRSILDRADIVAVTSDFLTLHKTGVRYTALCPFHPDKHTGNFIVYPKKNCYKCFACGAKGGVVDFLMNYAHLSYPDAIRWLGKKYFIETDNIPMNYTPPPPPPPPPALPVLEIQRSWVSRTMELKSIFPDWVRSIKWDNAQLNRISEALWLYCIGGWRDGRTVFWMIDQNGIPRAAKLMRYKPDGHRDKSRNPGWIYNQDGCREICRPDEHEILKPLFGMHLLNRYKNATVKIVESEKTALLMAIAYGNHAGQVWMACGGLENLNLEKLKPIIEQRRDIILYPDRDGIAKWKAKAENLHYDRVTVDCKPVTEWWKPEDGEKADIADVVIRMINNSKTYKTVDDVMKDMPKLKALHDKFNLEIENNEK